MCLCGRDHENCLRTIFVSNRVSEVQNEIQIVVMPFLFFEKFLNVFNEGDKMEFCRKNLIFV